MKVLFLDEKKRQLNVPFGFDHLINLTQRKKGKYVEGFDEPRLLIGDRVQELFSGGQGEGTVEKIEIDGQFIFVYLIDRKGFDE